MSSIKSNRISNTGIILLFSSHFWLYDIKIQTDKIDFDQKLITSNWVN